ncbi:hypothetical protein MTR_4g016900 [Medicago truncatula]|uniref:Uncharacterized protein n=1 Tax=Medicago truncatula TaxID=3880 RepID=G7ZXW5_MEDTR|nr:hypothetical protein MTR_4g016900 [Medicago truncatula]
MLLFCPVSCGFSCGNKSAGIPEDFAADNVSHIKFPANPDTAGKSADFLELRAIEPASVNH